MPLSLPCDACSFRRVKCDGNNPCSTCLRRQQPCTYLKVRKRRGPKGPRKSTNARVQAMQRNLGLEKSCSMIECSAPLSPTDDTLSTPGFDLSAYAYAYVGVGVGVSMPVRQVEMSAYYTYIDIFRSQLYAVWPIVSTNELKAGLGDESNAEAYALAAALCAATLAQLHLPGINQATDFVRDCLQLQHETGIQGLVCLESLLTFFFLHIYYANVDQPALAALSLRDAITRAHLLNLADRVDQLSLCIYWTLLIAERTFCLQNDLPMILQTIDSFPVAVDEATTGLCYLIHLYTQADALFQRPCSSCILPTRAEIAQMQESFQRGGMNATIDEVQRVEIAITTAWLSCLAWQYSASHFMLSPEDSTLSQYFCPSYPFVIASNLLSSICPASMDSIRPLGYGMEVKLFQLANSMIDVLIYVPSLSRLYEDCDWGPQDAVLGLMHLLDIFSGKSNRVNSLRRRLAQIDLVSHGSEKREEAIDTLLIFNEERNTSQLHKAENDEPLYNFWDLPQIS